MQRTRMARADRRWALGIAAQLQGRVRD